MTNSNTAATTSANPDHFARNVLRANTIFSVASGLLLLLAAPAVVQWIGLSGDVAGFLLAAIGAGVLLFAGYVGWSASHAPVNQRDLTVIAGLDLLWALLSYGLVFSGLLGMTTTGNWLVLLVADVVLVLGLLELFALYKLRSVSQ